MRIFDVVKSTLNVGTPLVVQGSSSNHRFMCVFEDDGDAGYFYALDMESGGENPIVDAVHIYNSSAVTDGHIPSNLTIGWSESDEACCLVINRYVHAIFDFQRKRGYSRTDFPPPPADGEWSTEGHGWSDDALKLFE